MTCSDHPSGGHIPTALPSAAVSPTRRKGAPAPASAMIPDPP
jgi:hypothetical protein